MSKPTYSYYSFQALSSRNTCALSLITVKPMSSFIQLIEFIILFFTTSWVAITSSSSYCLLGQPHLMY